ncbi:hypothetical protein [Castellaniella sp.]|uniref:hypothetical protein n=1 Tax=Castellaniella sp. TaxID=1955812 RepID=UPI003567CD4C
MSVLRKPFLYLGALWIALVPLAAVAAGTATVVDRTSGSGETMKLAWQDDGSLRINVDAENPDEFMLIRDGKVYAVAFEDGAPLVMEVSGMLKAMGGMLQNGLGADQPLPADIASVEPTGQTETVAGLPGRVYRITAVDADGERTSVEAVLTDDARAAEMTRVFMTGILSLFGQGQADDFLAALPADGKGMLRYGSDYALGSISGQAPHADQFELPAPPVDLAEMLKRAQ